MPEDKFQAQFGTAFVFIKPQVVTDKVKELAMAGLQEAGLKIVKEGSIKAEATILKTE